ncbi:hypothetical protein KIL84_015520 [Mauremys mutica]|uniref:Uncharacterized protein n=1 Tax=Mauremys mutica TaxID=74926 RepID=A0A9D4APT8_9SAUR|nr:hypothetical protein KIL84_015520 [Mauremys mutica]
MGCGDIALEVAGSGPGVDANCHLAAVWWLQQNELVVLSLVSSGQLSTELQLALAGSSQQERPRTIVPGDPVAPPYRSVLSRLGWRHSGWRAARREACIIAVYALLRI